MTRAKPEPSDLSPEQFSVLKGELERLLVNNKGLTSQRAAAQHRQSEAAAPQSAGKESTASSADSFLSYCSSSERAAYPGTEFVEVDRNDRMHYMPQRQLADDVAQLLQHVDSAMDAAIVPADASQAAALTMGRCDPNGDKQPAINRLKEQQQQLQQPISRHVSSAHPNSYSVTQPSERNAARELSLKPDQIAMPQPIRHQAANTADWNQLSWRDTHDLTAEIACAESAVAVSRQIVSQPDQVQPNNVTILHAACSVQSPDSLPAAAPSAEEQTTVASSVSAAPATVSAVLAAQIVVDASAESGPQASEAAAPREAASPHKWHTNGLAQEGSQASVSGSSTSQQQAAVSASSPQHSRDGSEQQCKRLHFSECAENIAPAWQHTGSPNTKGKDRAGSGLLEGYALGACAKQLKLPAASLKSSKSGKSSALGPDSPESRTPLKTITQVFQQRSRLQQRAEGHQGGGALQTALQGSTAAMEQQLLTAEATMQAMLSQLQGSRSKQIPAKAPAAASAAELEHIEDAGSFPQQLSEAHRQIATLAASKRELQSQLEHRSSELQHCTALLQSTEQQLNSRHQQLHRIEGELHSSLTALAVAEQQLEQQLQQVQHWQQLAVAVTGNPHELQQQDSRSQSAAAAPSAMIQKAAAGAAGACDQEELELLKDKLHDSVELLGELEQQLLGKEEEADDSRARLQATQHALDLSQQLVQDTKQLLAERTNALQDAQQLLEARSHALRDAEQLLEPSRDAAQELRQHLEDAKQLLHQHSSELQQQKEQMEVLVVQLQAAEHRAEQLEATHQSEVRAHAQTQAQVKQHEKELQSARTEQQSDSQTHKQLQQQLKQTEQQLGAALQDRQDAPEGADEYRQQMQAMEKRCARLEGRLAAELNRTQQVSRQASCNALEASQCRSKLQHAEHMLTAAYAANAAMQVRLQQRASGSQHLQQLPLPSVIPNTAPQQTPTSSSSVPHGGSDSHRHSPTANLAAVLARAAHNSPALLPNPKAADASANAGVHGNAEVGTAERASVAQQSQAGVAVQRLPAARAKLADAGQPGLPSGLSAIAPAEQPTRPDSGHSASRPGGSSSSSASFDSWRLNGQKHDGTDSAPTSLINMSPLQMGTPTQSPAAEATLRQSDAAAAAIPQRGIRDRIIGKEGWTDSQVQQSGLMPGRQHRQFGQPHMPLHSPPAWQNNPRRRKDALKPAKAGRIVLLGAPLTPLSAQGSTGPMPWADGQRQGLSPAGSESSSRFRGAAAELSPLATALASIRYLL